MIANKVYMDTYMLEHPVLRPGKVCICSFPGSKASSYSELDPHDAFSQDLAVMYLLGIHCMGGRGRSGTVAAMLLIHLGRAYH